MPFIDAFMAVGKRKPRTKFAHEVNGLLLSIGDNTVDPLERRRRTQQVTEALGSVGIAPDKIEIIPMRDEKTGTVKTFLRIKAIPENGQKLELSELLTLFRQRDLISTEIAEETQKNTEHAQRGLIGRLFKDGPIATVRHLWKTVPMQIVGTFYAVGDVITTIGGVAESQFKVDSYNGDLMFGGLCSVGTAFMFLVDAKKPTTTAQQMDADYCEERKKAGGTPALSVGLPEKPAVEGGFGSAVFQSAEKNAAKLVTGINAFAASSIFLGAVDRAKMGNSGAALLRTLQGTAATTGFVVANVTPPKGVFFEETGLGRAFQGNALLRPLAGRAERAFDWLQDHRNTLISFTLFHNFLGLTGGAKGIKESAAGVERMKEKYADKHQRLIPVLEPYGLAYKPWTDLYEEQNNYIQKTGGWYNPLNWVRGMPKAEGLLAYQQIQGQQIRVKGAFVVDSDASLPPEKRIRVPDAYEMKAVEALKTLSPETQYPFVIPNTAPVAGVSKDISYGWLVNGLAAVGGAVTTSAEKTASALIGLIKKLPMVADDQLASVTIDRKFYDNSMGPDLHDASYEVTVTVRHKNGTTTDHTVSLYSIKPSKLLNAQEAAELKNDVGDYSSQRRNSQDGLFVVVQSVIYAAANGLFALVKPHHSIADPFETAAIVANRVLDNLNAMPVKGELDWQHLYNQSVLRIQDQAAAFAGDYRIKAAAKKGLIPGVDPKKPKVGLVQALENMMWASLEEQAILRGEDAKLGVVHAVRSQALAQEIEALRLGGATPAAIDALMASKAAIEKKAEHALDRVVADSPPTLVADPTLHHAAVKGGTQITESSLLNAASARNVPNAPTPVEALSTVAGQTTGVPQHTHHA